MLKKFYIVKDYKDLISGQVIPRKILDSLPYDMFSNNPYEIVPYSTGIAPYSTNYGLYPTGQGVIAQYARPVPVNRGELEPISVGSPSPSFSISNMFSNFNGPSTDVSITRIPLVPQSPCGSPCNEPTIIKKPIVSPCGPVPCGQSQVLGAPIIKITPMIQQQTPGIIKIITDSNKVFTLNIPYNNIRNVVNELYLRPISLDNSKPKITFRIITPTIDTSLMTTADNMIELLRNINNKYSGVIYKSDDGKTESLENLLTQLLNLLETHRL